MVSSTKRRTPRKVADTAAVVAPVETIEGATRRSWDRENRTAIDQYNVAVASRGVFSDTWRRF